MKWNLEQYLYPIDQSFADKSQRDIIMIYVMIATVFFAFSYLLFWDGAENDYHAMQKARQSVEMRLKADEIYLQQHPESEIEAIAAQIKVINAETVTVQEKNDYIKYKIGQISELFYNEKAWGSYIDSIVENARRYKIKLAVLTNKKTLEKEKFGHVLNINIKASGHYGNMIRFVNAMEQSDLVIDLHDFNLSAQERLVADINSSVWGITY